MNLKGIMQTLGAKPGQVVSNPYARAFTPQPTITEAEGEDHEVSMAQNSLDTIIKMATELKAKMGENEKDIPAWIQDHITNSENFISQASSNYHEYSTNEAGINGAPRFPSLDGVANEAVELPTTALPSTVKSKLTIAIDTIKDAELTYNQKVQVVKQVTDSLGIDKTEFNKIASRLKGTMESVNEAKVFVHNEKTGEKHEVLSGKGKGDLIIAMKALEKAAPSHMKYSIKESVNESSYRVVGKNKDGEVFKSGVLDNKKAKDLYYKMAKSKSYVTLDVVKESVNEGKFKKDDLVYNTRTKTVGIVRMGDDKYGEVKTDADGNVNVDELEKYNPIKHKHQQNAKVAPSTEKEVNSRGLFNPFKAESLRLTKLK
jgi:hypothetical protein